MESNFKIKDMNIHKKGVIGYASQLKRDFQIHFLKIHNLQPNDSLLDVGCGTLRGAIPLIDYLDKDKYVGVEMRKKAYDQGLKELSLYPNLKGKTPTVICKNFADFESDRKFNYIWAFAVLFHIPDEALPQYFVQVDRYLEDGGIFYGNIAQETHSKWGKDLPNNPEYPMLYRSLEHYQAAAEKSGLIIEDIGANSTYGHVGHSADEDGQRMLKIQRK